MRRENAMFGDRNRIQKFVGWTRGPGHRSSRLTFHRLIHSPSGKVTQRIRKTCFQTLKKKRIIYILDDTDATQLIKHNYTYKGTAITHN